LLRAVLGPTREADVEQGGGHPLLVAALASGVDELVVEQTGLL
jgi:hypothetical protein